MISQNFIATMSSLVMFLPFDFVVFFCTVTLLSFLTITVNSISFDNYKIVNVSLLSRFS